MSRPHRLDFHGAIHLVRVRGKEGFEIFFNPTVLGCAPVERGRRVPHLVRFLALLDVCCSECDAELFGYCIEPNDASLILRMRGAPLHLLMQRLSGRYSRNLHKTGAMPERVRPFAARYESRLIAPEYLPHALRRVHALPLRLGLARRAVDYPFSSATAYLGERAPVRLRTDALWKALEQKGMFGLRGYREFMVKPETTYVAELFEHGSSADERIVGGSAFVTRARDMVSHPRVPATQQQLLEGVAKSLGMGAEELYFGGHAAVLGRALVAWHAMRSGTASIRQVATWFGVSGGTLGKAIRHHRRLSPSLFQQILPGIGSAGSTLEE